MYLIFIECKGNTVHWNHLKFVGANFLDCKVFFLVRFFFNVILWICLEI